VAMGKHSKQAKTTSLAKECALTIDTSTALKATDD